VRSGLVVVDKSPGMTSHDVVARVRRLAGTRKVGHAGTLDPMATGVLVLGVNKATRLLGHLMLTEKAYDATIRLGVATTTDDAEGEKGDVTDASTVTDEQVRTALAGFVGVIDQVPSSVSAIKVDGRRAYARVRAGDVSVRCSSGTYIRAIARDLGAALDVGGHLTALRRTAVGSFTLDAAATLDQLADELTLVPIEDAARACFPAYDLGEEQATDVGFGRKLAVTLPAAGPVALFAPDGTFLALYEQDGDLARAVAVFTD
jgi:tRNA pseudouridine55 synthase